MPAESYIQWCNENEGRAYPIADHASQIDLRGLRLPSDILADACIMVPPAYADAYVSLVRATPALLSVCIASSNAGLLHCTVARSGYVPYTAVPLVPMVPDVSGWVVFGNHVAYAPELYRFGPRSRTAVDQSSLARRAVRVVERVPVRRFSLLHGDAGAWVDKLVRVLGGTGLSVRKSEDAEDTVIIELAPDRAESFLGPCNRYGDGHGCPAAPICCISGVKANQDGDLTLRFRGVQ